jgi:uncharacterized protein (TIGR00266 family)
LELSGKAPAVQIAAGPDSASNTPTREIDTMATACSTGWYWARGQEQVGPFALDDLVRQIRSAPHGERTLVFGPGMATWTEARLVPQIAAKLYGGAPMPSTADTVPPPVPSPGGMAADEIDYEICGNEMQYVEVTLDPGEMVTAEPGAMMYMSPGIKMNTVFGDPSNPQQGGLLGKLMTAGKRALTGESLFITTFSNISSQREQVAFASPYPGKIIPLDLRQLGGEMICQKDSFLCAARGVRITIAFQKKLGAGLFGGEGFIMQRLYGDGVALVHAGGTLMRRKLNPGETLRVDTGCLVAMTPSVNYDIQFVGGFKNTLFGGEGLFFATLTGPGEVWLQSLPFSRLAGRIWAAAPQAGGRGREEGSVLGGIGRLLDGDNS